MSAQGARRAHLTVPKSLLIELDQRVGVHSRSETIVELVEEYLRSKERLEFFGRFAGSMPVESYPEWQTRASTAAWVQEQRTAERDLAGP